MIDIIYPENATVCIEQAKTLGFSEVYVFIDSYEKAKFQKNVLLVNEKEFSKLQKYKHCSFVAKGTRAAFENKQIQFILPDFDEPKDHTHYRRSGMDNILAELARKTKKTIVLDFSLLFKVKSKQRLLGRMMQNAMLCKKYHVPLIVASFAKEVLDLRSAKDFEAFLRILT
jgi:RNase P/RNase MRP subunit p30